MAKILAICGKICSGKTYYSKQLKQSQNAVVLSCDELTSILFNNNLGEKHDEMSKKIWEYLLKKAVDIVMAGTNVILDWGFWSQQDREYINQFFKTKNINIQWHYLYIDDKTWQKNIDERNQKVLNGNSPNDYYLDEGLMRKLLSKWEEPTASEIDVYYTVKR